MAWDTLPTLCLANVRFRNIIFQTDYLFQQNDRN